MMDPKEFARQTAAEMEAERGRPHGPALSPENLPKDAPACISYILKKMPPKSEHVNFNWLVIDLITYFQLRGFKLEGALGIVGDFLLRYSHSETYDTAQKRVEHFRDQWEYFKKNNGYKFDCSFMRGHRLPGSAFDCKKCGINSNTVAEVKAEKPPGPDETLNIKTRDPLLFPSNVMTGTAERFAELYSSYLEPPKQFFYMAFLACLGAHINLRLFLKSSIRAPARTYIVLLGASADDRKSTACDQTIEFFKNAFLEDFPVCRGVGSAEGLQKRLCGVNERLLLYYDEFKAFVSKCRIDGSVLLPCVNTLFESDRYESQTKKTKINIENGALTLLAASTAETYQATWSQQFTDIGFNNRLWLVTGAGQRKFAFPKPIPVMDRIRLQDELKSISQMVGDKLEIGITAEAHHLFQAWYMGRESSIHAKRLDGYALRFMQLLAVNDLKREIDLETVQKTIALCDWQLQVRKLNDPIGADNAIARLEQNIQRQLEMRGDLLESALMKHVNARNAGLFFYQNAIANLEKAGLIEQFMFRKKRHFRFISDQQAEVIS